MSAGPCSILRLWGQLILPFPDTEDCFHSWLIFPHHMLLPFSLSMGTSALLLLSFSLSLTLSLIDRNTRNYMRNATEDPE